MCERPRQTGDRIIEIKADQCDQQNLWMTSKLHTFTSFSWEGFPLYINCFFCHWGSLNNCLCPLKSWPSFSGCLFWGDGLDNAQANKAMSTSFAILECACRQKWRRNKLWAGLYTRKIPIGVSTIVGQVLCVPSHIENSGFAFWNLRRNLTRS